MREVLLFGGAFNPPTKAHIGLGEYACRKTGACAVIYMPAKREYVAKSQAKDYAFGDEERLEMLRKIAEKREWMEVSDWEIRQAGQPRTYHTLCHLRDRGMKPRLLLGSDKLPEMEAGWMHVDRIAGEFGIVVLERGKDDAGKMIREDPFLRKYVGGFAVLQTPEGWKDVSSSAVRQAMRKIMEEKRKLREMVPEELDGMEEYMEECGR